MPWAPPVAVLVSLTRVQIALSFFHRRDRRTGRQKEPPRGPTGPVSSRAFLELILFVGCQPVAGEAGPGKGGRRM